MEILAHDSIDSNEVLGQFFYCPSIDAGLSCNAALGVSSSGTAASPFTGYISSDLVPYGLVKSTDLYFVQIGLGPAGLTSGFREVNVYYRRQVSTPLPGTQTFGDVPDTFLYYKAIEALSASGITAGCGGGNFCPAGNVTRGEMAAFLARALGLHFPN
jgi:hypothetical protein